MCDIPPEVADAENVVRAIFSNHVDGRTLKRTAFFERNDDLSVMRHNYMGTADCKKRAQAVKPANPNIKYKGLAIMNVLAVRRVSCDAIDSRDGNYCGHAHIRHGLALPPAEDPLYAEQKLQLDERLRDLKKTAKYFPDPNPSDEHWTGEEPKPIQPEPPLPGT